MRGEQGDVWHLSEMSIEGYDHTGQGYYLAIVRRDTDKNYHYHHNMDHHFYFLVRAKATGNKSRRLTYIC